MAKNKNPDQRKSTLAEMVEKNFEDEGSKILFGVIADGREGADWSGDDCVEDDSDVGNGGEISEKAQVPTP